MSDYILKSTKCGKSCEYSKITTFCLDCPALMCESCEINLHRNVKHKIIPFQNKEIKWDDKAAITGLFEDKNMAISVFQEVNRKITMKAQRKAPVPIPTNAKPKSTNVWTCGKCTYENKSSVTKCEMCQFFRITENFEIEYRSKLDSFGDVMCPLFLALDENCGALFEHAIREYKNSGTKKKFLKWYENDYLNGRNWSVINEVIEEHGHHISMDSLQKMYNEITLSKNRSFLNILPETLKKPTTLKENVLLEPSQHNESVTIPDHMIKSEATTKNLWKVVSQKDMFSDRQKRMLITELNLPSREKVDFIRAMMQNAELGPYLVDNCPDKTVKIEHFRQAVVDHIEFTEVTRFLKKECCLCLEDYPMPEMQLLLICSHEFCKNCFKQWLESNITSRYPCKWGCPFCPDEYFAKVDKNLHYFNLRDFLNENKCDKAIIKMFDEKLLNERLMKSENFHWCANDQCVNGFEAEGENMKVQCPSCNLEMCVKCNREWKKEHENATCQQYEMWILKNDPNLAKVLNDIGIECPNCQMRYALAPGGCLHFDCKTCGWVFCGGCYSEFTSKCKVANCTMGTAFHAHHPRNCLYFLRDYDAKALEEMLKNADYPRLHDKPDVACPFMVAEDKTLANKKCGEPVCGTSGLCDRHYKEYLVQFINRLKIDPADTAKSDALNLMLFQGLKDRLKLAKGEAENAFALRLRNEVKKSCPFYVPKGLEVVTAAAP